MIEIINKKIKINTRLLGGSYTTKTLSSNGHTIVESGQILNIQYTDSNTLQEQELTGMIIAKPGSVVILKNIHIKESSFHNFIANNVKIANIIMFAKNMSPARIV